MIEIVTPTPALSAMFDGFRAASLGWDGSDPIRLRAPLPEPT
jgi:hypothetical protein